MYTNAANVGPMFRNAESPLDEMEEDGSKSDSGIVGVHFEEPGSLVFTVFSLHQTFCCSGSFVHIEKDPSGMNAGAEQNKQGISC